MVVAAQSKPKGQTADDQPLPSEDQQAQTAADPFDAAEPKSLEADDFTIADAPISVKVCLKNWAC